MLELYNANGEHQGALKNVIGQHCCRTLADGDETLDFEIPRTDKNEAKLETEGYVRTGRQEYVIKSLDRNTSSIKTKVEAALNVEHLQGTVITGGFESVEKTMEEAVQKALVGTGWRCSVAEDITKRRTIRVDQDTTAWEVVKAAVSTYKAELRIETLEKCLYFVEYRGDDKGAYFYEEINLRSLGVTASSYGFYTRLVPIGKDGLRLWVDGKDYIENHQYSQKIITEIWRDDRYTNTTSLYEDATERLNEASRPVMAYTGALIDLAKTSGKYAVLDYDLGDTVLLSSGSMGVWVKQRIVKVDEYEQTPEKNTAEFSNVAKTFSQIQKEGDDLAKKEAIQASKMFAEETLKDGYYTKEEVTTAIRAMENQITLEVSKSYMTVAEGRENAETAQKAAESTAREYTDGCLVEYSTTSEMDAAIKVASDAIELKVSETYATTERVEKISESAAADLEEAKKAANVAAADAEQAKTEAAAAKTAAENAAEDATQKADAAKDAAIKAAATKSEEDAAAAEQAAIAAAAAQSAADAAAAEAAAKVAAAEDAKGKADQAAEDAKQYTDTCLIDYSTTSEVAAAIKVATDAIELEVSKKYSTKEETEKTLGTLQEAADKASEEAEAAKKAAETATSDAAAANQAAADAQAKAEKAEKDAAAAEENAAEDAAEKAEAAKQAAIEAAAAQSAADAAAAAAEAKEAAATDAKAKADAAANAAKEYTDGCLVEYSTTLEVDAAIKVATDAINLAVGKTYYTKSEAQQSAEALKAAADKASEEAEAAKKAAETATSDAAAANQAAADAQAKAEKAEKDAAAAEENAAEDAAEKAEAAKQAAIEAAAAQSAADAAAAEAAAKEAAAEDAQGKATQAAETAQEYTDGRLVEYSTKEETRSAISIAQEEIELNVVKRIEGDTVSTEEMDAAMKLLADEMTLKFSQTNKRVDDVDDDLQAKFNTIVKYFTFDIDGLTIGEVDNPNKVIIDNDEISILVNGVPVQSFDSMGRALTPELYITKMLTLLGYQMELDDEGNLNCGYAGG